MARQRDDRRETGGHTRYGSRWEGRRPGTDQAPGDPGTGAQGFGSEDARARSGGSVAGSQPGDTRRVGDDASHGNPRTGSQRGGDRGQGLAGHVGGQRGGGRGEHVSPARRAGYHGDDWHGGEHGTSQRQRRYGSRWGHGSRRREPPARRDE